jgi:hypothetical protein
VAAGGTADELFQVERRSEVAGAFEQEPAALAARQTAYTQALAALTRDAKTRDVLVAGAARKGRRGAGGSA